MNVVEKIKIEIKESYKSKNEKRRSILKVALAEISRKADPATNEQARNVIRKIIESNNEMIKQMIKISARSVATADFQAENDILKEFLPTYMGKDDIEAVLDGVKSEILGAKGTDQATGIAVKYIKGFPHLNALGKDISATVRKMRGK